MPLPPNTHEERFLEDVIKAFPVAPSNQSKKLLEKAYNTALKAHEGQTRASGVPYIQHCLATAQILAGIGLDARTVAAGLLHDVPEDTDVTLEDLEKEFGTDIANMIEGITKLGTMKLQLNAEEYRLENWRRMFLAMGEDIRTVIIKLADRLHNMRTLGHLRPEKQQRIAHETMEIFVPIANRLGIGEIRAALAENAFRYLDPGNYRETKEIRAETLSRSSAYIDRAIDELSALLKDKGVRVVDMHGRAKALYSLYLKIKKYEGDIDRVYDIIALRIIVPDVSTCYKTLGILHSTYKPMVGRIKDYISLPKPNGYQSLHTTIFGPEKRILEIQVRTKQMHDEAELGIAAHWLYEEKKNQSWRNYLDPRKKKTEVNHEVMWARQLQEWQRDLGNNPDEFIDGIKMDFLKNHIFAYTPKGDVIELPEGATIVDFAYAIHTDIGNTATGARTSGKMVSLDTTVQNGQVIEIITDKNRKKPNADWLQFVKTSHAKSAIRRQNKIENQD